MPYFKTGLGYMDIYDKIRGVVIIGTYVDIENIRQGEPSPRALDIAQEFVEKMPQDWIPYVHIVNISDMYKRGSFDIFISNSFPDKMLEAFTKYVESDGWKFVVNAPIERKDVEGNSEIANATRKSVRMSFFERSEGESGKEFPIEEAEKIEEMAVEYA